MKRGIIFIILAFVFLIYLFNSASSMQISGEALRVQTNISIAVENIGPIIQIFSPKENRTYRNESIFLNYSVFDPEGISLVWYNFDNGNNISLGNASSGDEYFNVSEGSHTLYFYANDTFANESNVSVGFFANNTRIIVIYETFRTGKKGNSTDFDSLGDEELENLTNMALEDIDYGKILWNEAVNITKDEDPSDRKTTLDYDITLTGCLIFVDGSMLPNLNKKATLWFYNLTFDDPRILRNGVVCPSSICTNQNYSSGIFKVDVSGFTNYSVEESPSPSSGRPASVREKITNFSVDKKSIKVSLKQGDAKTEYIEIKNNGEKKLRIIIDVVSIKDFVEINEKEFDLDIGASKTIDLSFAAGEDAMPELYVGKLLIKGDSITREVLVAVEVGSKLPLLAVKVEIPPEFKEILPGNILEATITIQNISKISLIDVKTEYFIQDAEGNILMSEEENITIGTLMTFVKTFKIPKAAEPGDYILYVRTTYNENIASDSAFFKIIPLFIPKPKWIFKSESFLFFILALAIVIALIVIAYKFKHRKTNTKG